MIEIFKDYQAFLERPDKSVNGISPEVAEVYPEFLENSFSLLEFGMNEGCWNCVYCKGCKNCVECNHCTACENCSYCYYVSHSFGCVHCMHSDALINCADCVHCNKKEGLKLMSSDILKLDPPVVPNIHQAVLRALLKPYALDMSNWHSCNTTHCRGGWAIHLAGNAGYELEFYTNSIGFAASLIYRVSSPIPVPMYQFHVDEEIAIKDIQRCADLEAAL